MSLEKIHLIKLCVGANTISDLCLRQANQPFHITRIKPKRSEDILSSGGSIYWVIQRQIVCRQKIIAFEDVVIDTIKKCKIVFDANIIPVRPWPRNPFQGWRYLADAPEDIGIKRPDKDETPLPHALSIALDQYGIR